MPTDRLRAVPRHRDLAGECAAAVVAHFEAALPDLRRAVILLPHHLQHRRLRRCILECARARGHAAVLPPMITTFHALFLERAPPGRPALSEHERKLLLATALDEHPGLLPRAGRWEFADQLLQLFDDIADNDPGDAPGAPPRDPPAGAAGLVQTLYHAWRSDRLQTPDVRTLYRDSLRGDSLTHPDEHVFVCGFNELSPCASAWAARLYQQGRLTLITHTGDGGRYLAPALETAAAIVGTTPAPAPTDAALAQLLTAAFTGDGAVATRARAIAERHATSPAAARIRVFKPESLEQHAFGIYLKLRDWLDAGVSPVAIVSQDRKLSRRLRAVIERGDVPLCDHAGWALSTTTSAATVAALLPPAEQGFGGDVVLALARSPHCRYGLDVMRTQAACACLERACARIEPFRNFDETVAQLLALNFEDADRGEDVKRIVRRIRDALAGLRRAVQRPLPALFDALFDALFETLDALGMTAALQKDEAGRRLLEELKAMAAACAQSAGDWNLWRRWILHTFEHENFIPKERSHLVELYSLRQSLLARPAGLVVAALDAGHTLPAEPMPLLDEDARRTLGLKGRSWRTAVQFDRFRTALESADHILLTCQRSDNGQTLTPSPWLDGLQHFHALAYGDDLEEPDLKRRAQAEIHAGVLTRSPAPPPARPQMPAPQLPAWPARLSVGDVQAAIVCPYRFFAKASLNLRPALETDDYDSARSYGVHLHRCLAALHGGDEKLPGPMDKPWSEEHRDYALALARAVVETEFAPSLDRHYSVAERMQKALEAVCWYVDWLIQNLKPETRFETETPRTATLAGGVELHGRPDCVIHTDAGVHVLDHKSGYAPSKGAMTAGEDVQLTAYALFYDNAEAVSYMNMKKHRAVTLAGANLAAARARLNERLETFKRDAADSPLPAWADDADCKHCAYPGVCRRDAWRGKTLALP